MYFSFLSGIYPPLLYSHHAHLPVKVSKFRNSLNSRVETLPKKPSEVSIAFQKADQPIIISGS
jgi:hypothetical protein